MDQPPSSTAGESGSGAASSSATADPNFTAKGKKDSKETKKGVVKTDTKASDRKRDTY